MTTQTVESTKRRDTLIGTASAKMHVLLQLEKTIIRRQLVAITRKRGLFVSGECLTWANPDLTMPQIGQAAMQAARFTGIECGQERDRASPTPPGRLR